MSSEKGQVLQEQVWGEIVAVLKEKVPSIESIA